MTMLLISHVTSGGSYKEILNMLENDIETEYQDIYGMTALMYAVYTCKKEIVELILNYSFNNDIMDNEGCNAVSYCCMQGDYDILCLLLDKANCNITICENRISTSNPLTISMINVCDLKFFKKLSSSSKLIHLDFNEKYEDDNTLIMYCIHYNYSIEMLQYLIELGCELNVYNDFGLSPLFILLKKYIYEGNVEYKKGIELLISYGAEYDKINEICRWSIKKYAKTNLSIEEVEELFF